LHQLQGKLVLLIEVVEVQREEVSLLLRLGILDLLGAERHIVEESHFFLRIGV